MTSPARSRGQPSRQLHQRLQNKTARLLPTLVSGVPPKTWPRHLTGPSFPQAVRECPLTRWVPSRPRLTESHNRGRPVRGFLEGRTTSGFLDWWRQPHARDFRQPSPVGCRRACANVSTDPVALHFSVIDCGASIVTVAVSSKRRGAWRPVDEQVDVDPALQRLALFALEDVAVLLRTPALDDVEAGLRPALAALGRVPGIALEIKRNAHVQTRRDLENVAEFRPRARGRGNPRMALSPRLEHLLELELAERAFFVGN